MESDPEEKIKISNSHLIYSTTGYANEEQIYNVISKALKKAGLESKIYINLLYIKGKTCQCGYIWVDDAAAFNMLTKFSNNQTIQYTKTVKTLNNSDSSNETSESPTVKSSSTFNDKINWADCTDDDDVPSDKGYTLKKIDMDVTLDPIIYTNEQINKVSIYDTDFINEPYYISLDAALIEDVRTIGPDESNRKPVHNVWVANNIPDFVTPHILLKYLQQYVTDRNVKSNFRIDNKELLLPYPHIRIQKKAAKSSVYITFNPNSTDGMFALKMCRQLKIDSGNKSATLYFNHLYSDK